MRRRIRTGALLAALGATFFTAHASGQFRLYVDPSASGTNDGFSWENARTDLSGALLQAEALAAGADVEIWVREGIHRTPDDGTGVGAPFDISPGVTVFGGFDGSESSLAERDVEAHPTILSGDTLGDDGQGMLDDNARHVIRGLLDAERRIGLDGLVIEGGYARGADPVDDASGGGMLLECGADIRHCWIRGNHADRRGSAIMLRFRVEPRRLQVSNTIFTDNTSSFSTVGSFDVHIAGGHTGDFRNCTFTSFEFPIMSLGTSDAEKAFLVVRNSIIHGRLAGTAMAQVEGPLTADVDFSCIETTDIPGGGSNVITLPPAFVDAPNGDLRLMPGSPCIDVGSNASVVNATDRDGAYRIASGDVDLGAYEFGSPLLIANTRLHVDDDASGDGTGDTWSNAMTDLGYAMLVAGHFASETEPVEIWVAGGTYRPASPSDNADPFASFRPGAWTRLYGNFEGTESSLQERDPSNPAHRSTMSGDIQGNDNGPRLNGDVSRGSAYDENVVHVVRVEGDASGLLMDGFTIKGGYASGAGAENGGGGMYLVHHAGAPAFRNLRFVDCSSSRWGGAIFVPGESHGDATFADCLFWQCDAWGTANAHGGGVHLEASAGAAPSLYSCRFIDCRATGSAGALYIRRNQVPVTNGVFIANMAFGDGGAVLATRAARFVNCSAFGNFAGDDGGGFYNIGNNISYRNCAIWGNEASSQGAGMYSESGSCPVVEYCIDQTWAFESSSDRDCASALRSNSVRPTEMPFLMPEGPDGIIGTEDDTLELGNGVGIDAGCNDFLPSDLADLDLDGDVLERLPLDVLRRARRTDVVNVPDTGCSDGLDSIVDIGAYEFPTDVSGYQVWEIAQDGFFTDQARWFTRVPLECDGAVFQEPGTYSVFLPGGAVDNARLLVADGDVTFDLSGTAYTLSGRDPEDCTDPTFAEPAIVIGQFGGLDASLHVVGPGSVSTADETDVVLGLTNGSSGRLVADGEGTVLAIGAQELRVGDRGEATLEIINGASVESTQSVLGSLPGGRGSVFIDALSNWSLLGQLEVRRGTIRLDGTDTASQVTAGVSIFVADGGSITGVGRITAPIVQNNGALVPGTSSEGPDQFGLLFVEGAYRQGGQSENLDSGTLEIDLGGVATSQYDRLVVDGPIELQGGLFVSLAEGTDPPEVGTRFEIVRSLTDDIETRFDVAYLPVFEDRIIDIEYDGPVVNLVVESFSDFVDFGDGQDSPDGQQTATAAALGAFRPGVNLLDLAVVTSAGDSEPGRLYIFSNAGSDNDGWNGYSEATVLQAGIDPTDVVVGDFDDDGVPDIANSNGEDGDVVIWLNDGSGAFATSASDRYILSPPVSRPTSLSVHDWNADGLDDLGITRADTIVTFLLRSEGGGSFSWEACDLDTEDDDGFTDGGSPLDGSKGSAASGFASLLVNSNEVLIIEYIGGGPPDFAVMGTIPVGAGASDLEASDLNGDGFPEIVTVNRGAPGPGDDTVSIIRNLGGVFAPAVNLDVGEDPRLLTLVDADLDGDLDRIDLDVAVVAGPIGSREVQVLRNDSVTDQIIFSSPQRELVEGEPVLMISGDLDANRGPDLNPVLRDDILLIIENGGPGPDSWLPRGLRRDACVFADLAAPYGELNIFDILRYLASFDAGESVADLNMDGVLNIFDIIAYLDLFDRCSG